jgi:hypothetical protein
MAMYKLVKDAASNVKIFKDGVQIGLYTEIVDLGVELHGWGGFQGDPKQVAFAVVYDIVRNKEQTLELYNNFLEVISLAAPLELDISTSAIISILNRNNDGG